MDTIDSAKLLDIELFDLFKKTVNNNDETKFGIVFYQTQTTIS